MAFLAVLVLFQATASASAHGRLSEGSGAKISMRLEESAVMAELSRATAHLEEALAAVTANKSAAPAAKDVAGKVIQAVAKKSEAPVVKETYVRALRARVIWRIGDEDTKDDNKKNATTEAVAKKHNDSAANEVHGAVSAKAANGTSSHKNRTAVLQNEEAELQKLFAHLKSNVVTFNKAEKEAKQENQKMLQQVQARLQHDKDRMKRANLTKTEHEMLVNRTRAEERELQYWTRGRELAHGMYHMNLKMSHGLLNKVKTVMDAYQQVLTKGKLDPSLRAAMQSASSSLRGF